MYLVLGMPSVLLCAQRFSAFSSCSQKRHYKAPLSILMGGIKRDLRKKKVVKNNVKCWFLFLISFTACFSLKSSVFWGCYWRIAHDSSETQIQGPYTAVKAELTEPLLYLFKAVTCEAGRSKLHTACGGADLRGRGLAPGHQAHHSPCGLLHSVIAASASSPLHKQQLFISLACCLAFLALNSASDRPIPSVCASVRARMAACVSVCWGVCMSKQLCATETPINYSVWEVRGKLPAFNWWLSWSQIGEFGNSDIFEMCMMETPCALGGKLNSGDSFWKPVHVCVRTAEEQILLSNKQTKKKQNKERLYLQPVQLSTTS